MEGEINKKFIIQREIERKRVSEINLLKSEKKLENILIKDFGTKLVQRWSQSGDYLACLHESGLSIWNDNDYEYFMRYKHKCINNIIFSSHEKYIITISHEKIKLWNLLENKKLKSFKCMRYTSIKFFDSERYIIFTCLDEDRNIIRIYDIEKDEFKELNFKELLEINILKNSDNFIVIEKFEENIFKINFYQITGENNSINNPIEEIYLEDTFHIRVENNGKYFSLISEKIESNSNEIYIFKIKEDKSVWRNVINFNHNKLKHIDIFWEPNGNRFLLNNTNNFVNDIYFYEIFNDRIILISTLNDIKCNLIKWSPTGELVLLGNKNTGNYYLYDIEKRNWIKKEEKSLYFNITDAKWHSSGNYLALFGIYDFIDRTNGYRILTTDCKILYEDKINTLYQFDWCNK